MPDNTFDIVEEDEYDDEELIEDSIDDDDELFVEEDEDFDDQAETNEDWEEADDPIADLVFDIVSRMGFKDAEIEWEERSDHVRYFIEGEDLATLIGRHGTTLEALQYLVGVINSRRKLVQHKIIVDIEGYRERREGRLRRLAQRTAQEVMRYGRDVVLEPMTAGDRRVIHLCLTNHSQVETDSEGVEPERCVVVKLKRQRR